MRIYENDAEVLKLAQADGCRQRLLAASRKPTMSAFGAWPRMYFVHVTQGDAGFSCVEVSTFSEWLELIERLPLILGPVASVRFEPVE